jgi:hypothetical protein
LIELHPCQRVRCSSYRESYCRIDRAQNAVSESCLSAYRSGKKQEQGSGTGNMKVSSVQHTFFSDHWALQLQAELVAGIDSEYSNKRCLPKDFSGKNLLTTGVWKGHWWANGPPLVLQGFEQPLVFLAHRRVSIVALRLAA